MDKGEFTFAGRFGTEPKDSGQADARHSRLSARLRHAARPFAHERRIIERPFARDDHVGLPQFAHKSRMPGYEVEPALKARTRIRREPKPKPARRSRARFPRKITS